MKMGRTMRWTLASLLGLALFASVAGAGAVEVARARVTAGSAKLMRGNQTSDVTASTQFQEGDVVRVPSDPDRLTVEFGDGASLALIGPSTLRFGPMDGRGRRVVLNSGVISDAKVFGIALEIQAPEPYDCSLVLQNAVASARVAPGDRVTFLKKEGNFARVYTDHATKYTELDERSWTYDAHRGAVVVPMERPVAGPAQPRGDAAAPSARLPNNTGRFVLGMRTISYYPASNFKKTDMGDGGVKLTFSSGAKGADFGSFQDEFGVVIVGRDTNIFLADGQYVIFDANGDIIEGNGLSHIYHPLTDAVFTDEPVENASDASPRKPRNR